MTSSQIDVRPGRRSSYVRTEIWRSWENSVARTGSSLNTTSLSDSIPSATSAALGRSDGRSGGWSTVGGWWIQRLRRW